MLQLKRAYEPPAPSDGRRILVDRLWPRGLSKTRIAIDEWMKELAPSPALIFGARDEQHNDAVVLASVIRRRMAR